MKATVALCIDEATCRNPELVGLDGENFEAQSWLEVFQSGAEARSALAEDADIERVWVVSCDDVSPINLAATLKGDRPELRVSLVESDVCGSLYSRASNALIDDVIDGSSFVRVYAEAKGGMNAVAAQAASTEAAALPGVASPAAGIALARRRAFVMPILSGSGGAGKSSVSVMSAHIAHRMGFKTLLLDYDLQFGDMAMLSGIADPLDVDEALMREDLLEAEIRREGGFSILSAPSRLESADQVVKELPDLLERLSECFDVIVVNTGAAWAEQHAVLLERSSAALFLIDQRASSVWACKHALELCSRCGIATGPFRFAVNRCAKGAMLSSIDVSCALKGASVFEIKDGGRDVEDFLSAGDPQELLDSRNEFCSSLEQVLHKILPDLASSAASAVVKADLNAAAGKRGKRGRRGGIRWGRDRS